VGAGVAKEVQSFLDRRNAPVFELHPLKSNVYVLPITVLNPARVLSVEDTRAKRRAFETFEETFYIEAA
jgi:hypothetical protein